MAPGIMAFFLTIFKSHIFLKRYNLKSDKIARVLGVAEGDYLQFGVSDVFGCKAFRPWPSNAEGRASLNRPLQAAKVGIEHPKGANTPLTPGGQDAR
jgi:hypothetical protein